MMLLTKENKKQLPPLYSQEHVKDPMVWVKFFYPAGYATWGALEFDGKDRFFGWASLQPGMGELGYFSLNELKSFRGRFGLGIERDMHFRPIPLSQFKGQYANPKGNPEIPPVYATPGNIMEWAQPGLVMYSPRTREIIEPDISDIMGIPRRRKFLDTTGSPMILALKHSRRGLIALNPRGYVAVGYFAGLGIAERAAAELRKAGIDYRGAVGKTKTTRHIIYVSQKDAERARAIFDRLIAHNPIGGYAFTKRQGYRPIRNEAKVSPELIKDIKSVIGGLYHLNAPHAIGYVFDPSADGKSIARGMFFDRGDNKDDWTYFLDYSTGVLSKVRR